MPSRASGAGLRASEGGFRYECGCERLLFARRTFHDCGKRPHVDWVAPLRADAEMVFPVDRATGATPDPFDEMVLEYDVAARADAIVSGDRKQFLTLGAYRGIPILGPVDFLTGT